MLSYLTVTIATVNSYYLLPSFLIEYFTENVIKKTKTESRTIVPLGAEFSIYDNTIPDTTETIDMKTEINAVLLKPVPNIMAVIFGITISEEISKIPTNLIEAITVTLARTMKR
jgi:hypothetical protein